MELAAIFTDNMVLMHNQSVNIFGVGAEGEEVTVTIDGITASAKTAQGAWRACLPPHGAGGPFTMTVSGAKRTVRLANVMYGEVWLASGQSNIELEVQNADFGEEELAAADYGDIRYYNVVKTSYIDEGILAEEAGRSWHMCRDGDFRDMSAVAYFYAKKLHEALRVPIGIIDCYQGGTSISCWLSEENLRSLPEGLTYLADYEAAVEGKTDADYDRELADYDVRLAAYNQRVGACKSELPDITPQELNEKAGEYPWPPPMGRKSPYRPAGLYTAMIKRVCPYTVKGIVYYQGEEDAVRTERYDRLLMKLIEQYRTDWENERLPIAVMQLPMYIAAKAQEDYSWPRLRAAQQQVCERLADTVLVVQIDTGEFDNIHPTDKRTPGSRLALQILDSIYGLPVQGSAMRFAFGTPKGDGLCLHFSNTYGRIQTLPNILRDVDKSQRVSADDVLPFDNESVLPDAQSAEEPPTGFFLSEDGNTWYCAKAVIRGQQVLVAASEVKMPAWVRYGYFNYGKVNIYNGAGLPLAPFQEKI